MSNAWSAGTSAKSTRPSSIDASAPCSLQLPSGGPLFAVRNAWPGGGPLGLVRWRRGAEGRGNNRERPSVPARSRCLTWVARGGHGRDWRKRGPSCCQSRLEAEPEERGPRGTYPPRSGCAERRSIAYDFLSSTPGKPQQVGQVRIEDDGDPPRKQRYNAIKQMWVEIDEPKPSRQRQGRDDDSSR